MKIRYLSFVGLDVSKEKVDACLIDATGEQHHFEFENKVKKIKGFLKQVHQRLKAEDGLKSTLFCLEHTGEYINRLVHVFGQLDLAVWVESASRIREVQGRLTRGKDDKVDARRIAEYAQRYQDQVRIWKAKRDVIVKLRHLFKLREVFVKQIKALNQSMKDIHHFDAAGLLKEYKKIPDSSVKALRADKAKVEEQIHALIREDMALKFIYRILTSVPGIGFVNAVQTIVATNEFTSFTDPKPYAVHGGVVPFPHQSGKVKWKERVSHKANKRIKANLQMAAMAAIKVKGDLQNYYLRKVADGKNKMSVLNAVRNKLIHIMFALIRDGREYQYSYA
ncbi:MAG: IS110 family transposase [Bacteroidota bacterium]